MSPGKRRKANRLVAAALLGVVLAGCSPDPKASVNTVSDFEVERYPGQWHQVAAIPAWLQSDCAANTAVDYALGKGGLIEVVKSCETADGSRRKAEARARSLDAETLRDIGHILEREAYDTCELVLTVPGRQGRLCCVTR